MTENEANLLLVADLYRVAIGRLFSSMGENIFDYEVSCLPLLISATLMDAAIDLYSMSDSDESSALCDAVTMLLKGD